MNMLHPDDRHLSPLESAARFYCKHRKLDPEQRIPVRPSDGLILPGSAVRTREAWLFIAEELLDLHIKLQALNIAREEMVQ
jgi:hypothetical protein